MRNRKRIPGLRDSGFCSHAAAFGFHPASDILPSQSPRLPRWEWRAAGVTVRAMKIREIMTPDAQCVGPEETLVDAAALMRQLDVGVLPVCNEGEVIGMITDRDIAIRAVAEARPPTTTRVREIMTPGSVYVFEDQDVDEVVQVMEEHQIRRAPVLSREKRIVGIVSLGDIAVDASASLSGEALKRVSQPAEPVR
jgi:CBS domain-containing protein